MDEAPRFTVAIALRKFTLNMLAGMIVVCGLLIADYADSPTATGANRDCFDYSTGAFIQC